MSEKLRKAEITYGYAVGALTGLLMGNLYDFWPWWLAFLVGTAGYFAGMWYVRNS